MKVRAIVDTVTSFGSSVYRVILRIQGSLPRMKPGQFLHLALDEYEPYGGFWPESRIFSIASAYQDTLLEFVYSVKGRFTKRMEKCLVPGFELWIKLPYGEFIIESAAKPGQSVILVAGGTGISPFLSYLANLLEDRKKRRTVRLYYGIRKNVLLMGRALIERCVDASLVDAKIYIEDEDPDNMLSPSIKMERGRLDIANIKDECEGLESAMYFISGPPMMIKSFRDRLLLAGVPLNSIKTDDWE